MDNINHNSPNRQTISAQEYQSICSAVIQDCFNAGIKDPQEILFKLIQQVKEREIVNG